MTSTHAAHFIRETFWEHSLNVLKMSFDDPLKICAVYKYLKYFECWNFALFQVDCLSMTKTHSVFYSRNILRTFREHSLNVFKTSFGDLCCIEYLKFFEFIFGFAPSWLFINGQNYLSDICEGCIFIQHTLFKSRSRNVLRTFSEHSLGRPLEICMSKY